MVLAEVEPGDFGGGVVFNFPDGDWYEVAEDDWDGVVCMAVPANITALKVAAEIEELQNKINKLQESIV